MTCFAVSDEMDPIRFEAEGWTLVIMPLRNDDIKPINEAQRKAMQKTERAEPLKRTG